MKDVVGFEGALRFDASKPDGTPRKLMDSSRLSALGWKPTITLSDGIASTYAWFLAQIASSGAGALKSGTATRG